MIADLKPYPAMKDSGVPWLGEVPEHWQLRRTKTLLRERVEKGHPEEPLLAATQSKGVVRKERYENRTVLALKDLHLLKLVRVGDFVISLRSFQGGIEYAHEQGIISPAYTILYPASADTHGYLARLFKSAPYIENLSLYVTGIRQGQNIDYEKLGRSELPLPPPLDQAAIVRFLGHADRRILRYIRAKQKLIKLLEEQKQAIIHRAVTRGLDPNVRLKPSGVEWLGDVPEHWEVAPLSRVLMQRKEKNDPIKTTNILSLSLKTGVIPYAEKGPGGNKAKEDVSAYMLAYPGDIVVNSMNVVVGSVGLSEYFGAVSPVYYMLRTRDPLDVVEYFSAIFRDVSFQRSLFGLGNGIMYIESKSSGKLNTIRLRIPMTRLKRVLLPRPPPAEQAAIVAHLDEITAGIAAALSRTEREIDLLREYRTRLIADVVTGKLDVREAATKLPDAEVDPEISDVADELADDEETTLDDLGLEPDEAEA